MELFVNDLSIRHQFHDSRSFSTAFVQLVKMLRDVAQYANHKVYIHQAIWMDEPIQGIPMQQAFGYIESNEKRAIMSWLSMQLYWDSDEIRQHGKDDYLICQKEIVTDSAVGEAAFRAFHGYECGLVSTAPSEWSYSPVKVTWCLNLEGSEIRNIDIGNWWSAAELKARLRGVLPPIHSWNGLADVSIDRFTDLTFASNCFEFLKGVPFSKSTSDRILELLGILDRFTRAFNNKGDRTQDGHQIQQEYFAGAKARFSDSSDTEKNRFQQKLTFPHPDNPGEELFCTWHGKENHSLIRLHFSWPIKFGCPTYVVYVGPKLTKR